MTYDLLKTVAFILFILMLISLICSVFIYWKWSIFNLLKFKNKAPTSTQTSNDYPFFSRMDNKTESLIDKTELLNNKIPNVDDVTYILLTDATEFL